MKLMPSLRTSAARAQQLHCEHLLPAHDRSRLQLCTDLQSSAHLVGHHSNTRSLQYPTAA